MKKILIPSDFSDNAKDALKYAFELNKNTNCLIHIFHVTEPQVITTADGNVINLELTKEQINKIKNDLSELEDLGKAILKKNEDKKIKIETSYQVGGILNCIKAKSIALSTDLIIMGTRGLNHSTLESIFGTISTHIVDITPCPVLFIPLQYAYEPLDHVLFTTILDSGDPFELNKAYKILSPHNPVVRCLYIQEESAKPNKKKIKDYAKYMLEHSPAIQTIFNIETDSKPSEVIEDYINSYEPKILILHKMRKNLLNRILHPSVSKKIINNLKVPLLVLNY